MGVNSLPKTVIRQRCDCDLNLDPSAPESSTLTTRLPSHPNHYDTRRIFYKESLVTKSWSMGNLWFVIQDWFLFLMIFLSRFLHFIVTGNQVLMHWNVCNLVFFCCWCWTLPVCLTVSCKPALYQKFLAYHHTGQLEIDELCKVKSNGCKWQFITCCYCIQSGQITRYLLLWFGTTLGTQFCLLVH